MAGNYPGINDVMPTYPPGNLQKFGLDRVPKIETLEEVLQEDDETCENLTPHPDACGGGYDRSALRCRVAALDYCQIQYLSFAAN
jgi:hypothetical protein